MLKTIMISTTILVNTMSTASAWDWRDNTYQDRRSARDLMDYADEMQDDDPLGASRMRDLSRRLDRDARQRLWEGRRSRR